MTVREWFRLDRAEQFRRRTAQGSLIDRQIIADLITRGYTAEQWILPDSQQAMDRAAGDLFIEHAHDAARRKLDQLIYELCDRQRPWHWDKDQAGKFRTGRPMSVPFTYRAGKGVQFHA